MGRHLRRQYHFDLDPVIAASRSNLLPIDWSRLDRSPPAIRHFFAMAKSFEIGLQELSLPIRGGNGVSYHLSRNEVARFFRTAPRVSLTELRLNYVATSTSEPV